MIRVPMFKPYINDAARERAADTLSTDWIGEGPRVAEFEVTLCNLLGFKYAVALNSGTAGLRLALAMCGVGPGDEVITTAQTCTATNTAILEQFATPVFADVQYLTGNIDPGDIEHRITGKTRAIMVVHWAGYPCDMDEINAIALVHGLPVIEDAAHALGSIYGVRAIGNCTADFTVFSFQAIKLITTGDGGLLTMRTEERYDEARRRRWFGIDRKLRRRRPDGYFFWNQSEVGYKMHMNDIAASIGIGNLRHFDELIFRRRQIVARYLGELEGVQFFERGADRNSANWLFTMHVEGRDDFCRAMRNRGVEVSVVHTRNDEHEIFGGLRTDLPVLDCYSRTQISIPLHNRLTDEDVDLVIESINEGW